MMLFLDIGSLILDEVSQIRKLAEQQADSIRNSSTLRDLPSAVKLGSMVLNTIERTSGIDLDGDGRVAGIETVGGKASAKSEVDEENLNASDGTSCNDAAITSNADGGTVPCSPAWLAATPNAHEGASRSCSSSLNIASAWMLKKQTSSWA